MQGAMQASGMGGMPGMWWIYSLIQSNREDIPFKSTKIYVKKDPLQLKLITLITKRDILFDYK